MTRHTLRFKADLSPPEVADALRLVPLGAVLTAVRVEGEVAVAEFLHEPEAAENPGEGGP